MSERRARTLNHQGAAADQAVVLVVRVRAVVDLAAVLVVGDQERAVDDLFWRKRWIRIVMAPSRQKKSRMRLRLSSAWTRTKTAS